MVAKITSGSNIYGVLKYNLDKVQENKADVFMCENMIERDDKIPDMDLMLDCFNTYLNNNNRTQKTVFHVSLNPHPDDHLSDERLKEIAQEYMNKMGYGHQPYLVFKHRDIEREHIHIVSVRVDEQGVKINDSYEHRHSKQITDALEKKYGLKPSTPEEEKKMNVLKAVHYKTNDVKRQIRNTVKELIKYRFQSVKEFNALLSLYNIGCEEVKGEVNGKHYTGLIYFALDEQGKPTGTRFKASLWGKQIGYETLLHNIENSKNEYKTLGIKEQLKQEILTCMDARNMEEFKRKLKDKNIDVIFRMNTENRIYGVTFIDHRNKYVFNGSKLGKQFSANVFQGLFSDSLTSIYKQTEQKAEPGKMAESGTDWCGLLLPTDPAPIYEKEKMKKPKKRKKRKRSI